MGATRALVTVRLGVTYVNDRELAAQHLVELRKTSQPAVVDDEITQRLSVVEAGMRVRRAVGGSFSTPLAEAISALRKLNTLVNIAKHVDTSTVAEHAARGLTNDDGCGTASPAPH